MKRTVLFSILCVAAITLSVNVSAQNYDFRGTWKLDAAKSTLPQNTPVLVQIDVRINGDSLLTERYYDTGDGQIYPFTENLTLDSKEYGITIYEMPRKTKASWTSQKEVSVESNITVNANGGNEEFISKETWKTDEANQVLTISFANKLSGMEATGTFVMNKAEK